MNRNWKRALIIIVIFAIVTVLMATLRCYAGNNGFWTEFELVVRTIITEFWKVLTNNVILIGISAIVVLRFGYRYILMVLSGIKKISAKEGTAEFDTGQFQSLLRQMGIGRGETSKSTGSDEKLNSSETVKLNLEDVDLSDSLFFNNSLVLRYLVEVDGQPLSLNDHARKLRASFEKEDPESGSEVLHDFMDKGIVLGITLLHGTIMDFYSVEEDKIEISLRPGVKEALKKQLEKLQSEA